MICFEDDEKVVSQLLYSLARWANLAGREVPVDAQVDQSLRWHELGLVKIDDDAEVCAKVCEAKRGVAECVAVSCEEEPVVNVLKRHDCHALASVALEGFKDFGKYLR